MSERVKRLLYEGLDAVTLRRGIPRSVCGETVRFPARWCRYYPSSYEPNTFEFLRAHVRAGSAALDVGAHIGLFTVLLARLVGRRGRVFSFEPTDSTREVLARTVELNGCAPIVEVRAEAIGSDTGTAQWYESSAPGCNSNSLVPPAVAGSARRVALASIDGFAEARDMRVGCMKIDVEGAELDVLRGAVGVLKRDRPVVALGVHPAALAGAGASLPELWSLITGCGMAARHGGQPVAKMWFEAQRELFDVQLLPIEK